MRLVGQVNPCTFCVQKGRRVEVFLFLFLNLVNCFGDILRNSGSGFDSLFSKFFFKRVPTLLLVYHFCCCI